MEKLFQELSKFFIALFFFGLSSYLLLSSCGSPYVSRSGSDAIKKINIQADFFELDQLKQLYFVSEDNALFKRNVTGDLSYNLSDNRNGNITYLDVSNPLQVLIYYGDFQFIKIVDRTLNTIDEISLLQNGFRNVNAIASASDDGIWFFDQDLQELIKINQNQEVILRSNNLRQLLDKSIMPSKMLELNNKLVLLDQKKESVYIFDVFADYIGRIFLPEKVKHLSAHGRNPYLLGESSSIYELFTDHNRIEEYEIRNLGSIEREGLIDAKHYQKDLYMLFNDHLLIESAKF